MTFVTQGKTDWKFLLIVIILAIVAGGGILYYWKNIQKEALFIYQQIPQIQINTKYETANWQTYSNYNYLYTIKYPADWRFPQSGFDQSWVDFDSGLQYPNWCSISIRNLSKEDYENDQKENFPYFQNNGQYFKLSSSHGQNNVTCPYYAEKMFSTIKFIPKDQIGTTTYEKVKCQEIQNIECDKYFFDDYTLKYNEDLHTGGNYTEQEFKFLTFENQDSIIRGMVQTYSCGCCGGTFGSEADCEINEQYFNIPPDNSVVRVRFAVKCLEDGRKTLEGQIKYNNESIDVTALRLSGTGTYGCFK